MQFYHLTNQKIIFQTTNWMYILIIFFFSLLQSSNYLSGNITPQYYNGLDFSLFLLTQNLFSLESLISLLFPLTSSHKHRCFIYNGLILSTFLNLWKKFRIILYYSKILKILSLFPFISDFKGGSPKEKRLANNNFSFYI